eukprot:PhF_6_TR37518/c0_g1_i2/m.55465
MIVPSNESRMIAVPSQLKALQMPQPRLICHHLFTNDTITLKNCSSNTAALSVGIVRNMSVHIGVGEYMGGGIFLVECSFVDRAGCGSTIRIELITKRDDDFKSLPCTDINVSSTDETVTTTGNPMDPIIFLSSNPSIISCHSASQNCDIDIPFDAFVGGFDDWEGALASRYIVTVFYTIHNRYPQRTTRNDGNLLSPKVLMRINNGAEEYLLTSVDDPNVVACTNQTWFSATFQVPRREFNLPPAKCDTQMAAHMNQITFQVVNSDDLLLFVKRVTVNTGRQPPHMVYIPGLPFLYNYKNPFEDYALDIMRRGGLWLIPALKHEDRRENFVELAHIVRRQIQFQQNNCRFHGPVYCTGHGAGGHTCVHLSHLMPEYVWHISLEGSAVCGSYLMDMILVGKFLASPSLLDAPLKWIAAKIIEQSATALGLFDGIGGTSEQNVYLSTWHMLLYLSDHKHIQASVDVHSGHGSSSTICVLKIPIPRCVRNTQCSLTGRKNRKSFGKRFFGAIRSAASFVVNVAHEMLTNPFKLVTELVACLPIQCSWETKCLLRIGLNGFNLYLPGLDDILETVPETQRCFQSGDINFYDVHSSYFDLPNAVQNQVSQNQLRHFRKKDLSSFEHVTMHPELPNLLLLGGFGIDVEILPDGLFRDQKEHRNAAHNQQVTDTPLPTMFVATEYIDANQTYITYLGGEIGIAFVAVTLTETCAPSELVVVHATCPEETSCDSPVYFVTTGNGTHIMSGDGQVTSTENFSNMTQNTMLFVPIKTDQAFIPMLQTGGANSSMLTGCLYVIYERREFDPKLEATLDPTSITNIILTGTLPNGTYTISLTSTLGRATSQRFTVDDGTTNITFPNFMNKIDSGSACGKIQITVYIGNDFGDLLGPYTVNVAAADATMIPCNTNISQQQELRYGKIVLNATTLRAQFQTLHSSMLRITVCGKIYVRMLINNTMQSFDFGECLVEDTLVAVVQIIDVLSGQQLQDITIPVLRIVDQNNSTSPIQVIPPQQTTNPSPNTTQEEHMGKRKHDGPIPEIGWIAMSVAIGFGAACMWGWWFVARRNDETTNAKTSSVSDAVINIGGEKQNGLGDERDEGNVEGESEGSLTSLSTFSIPGALDEDEL